MKWNPVAQPYRCMWWTGGSIRVETFATYGEAAHAAAQAFTRETVVWIDKAEHTATWHQNGSWQSLGTRRRKRSLVLTVHGRHEHASSPRCACGNLAVATDVMGEYHDELCPTCAHVLYTKMGAE